jgi:hypothetical protein
LDELAESVGKLAMENWRKRAERVIWNSDELQRRQLFKQGNVYVALDAKDTAKLRAAWEKGLKATLPAEAMKRLEGIRAERKVRQTRAWSKLLIVELDRRVAFTSAQRERLGPIVERLVGSDPALTADDSDAFENGMPLQILYTAGGYANEAEMKTILDDMQWKRWKDACRNRGNDVEGTRFIARNFNAQAEEKQTTQSAEPEEIEGVLSDYLYNKASAERARALNAMILKAEDAARVAALPSAAVDRLLSAARGATEQSLNEWKAGLTEAVRPYANGGTCRW